MIKIEMYVVKFVAEGGESSAEDDLNETEEFEESEERQWCEVCDFGVDMVQVIVCNAESFVSWYRLVSSDG